MRSRVPIFLVLLAILLSNFYLANAQDNLYTARGYWEEVSRSNYSAIKKKQEKGDSLSTKEKNYLKDYELFLQSYFQKMPQDEREDFERLKSSWDKETQRPAEEKLEDFELRTRDRLTNGLYGLYYGLALVALTDATEAPAAGIPLITSGLWMMGPAINRRKYENIRLSTIRAGNSGRFLGLVYGAGLGLAIGGESDSETASKMVLGLSAVGSIALGEIAFQAQKRKNHTQGYIEMERHYGILGPAVATAALFGSGVTNANAYGAGILAGGIGGLLIGKQVANRYDYTRGDVGAISSLSLISAGIGFTAIAESIEDNDDYKSLLFVPAATAIAATILEQRAVRGVYLTDKQGSTITLGSGGAALIGLGVVAITESASPAVLIGVPSGCALIMHQLLFHKYKRENLELKLRGSNDTKSKYNLSLRVTPESYFMNRSISANGISPQRYADLQSPVFKLTVKF